MDNKRNERDIEYTIVMDPGYTAAIKAERNTDPKQEIDLLYREYEHMCLREATVIDRDDIYPHSYQWRMGDKYDPAKVALVKEALKQNKKIADTEEYQAFVEAVKNSRIETISWD